MSVAPMFSVAAVWLLVVVAGGIVIAYRPKGEDRGGVKFRIMAAACALLALGLSIFSYVYGENLLECIILMGAGVFMAFVAIINPGKSDSN